MSNCVSNSCIVFQVHVFNYECINHHFTDTQRVELLSKLSELKDKKMPQNMSMLHSVYTFYLLFIVKFFFLYYQVVYQ